MQRKGGKGGEGGKVQEGKRRGDNRWYPDGRAGGQEGRDAGGIYPRQHSQLSESKTPTRGSMKGAITSSQRGGVTSRPGKTGGPRHERKGEQ
eukprot:8956969-Prorocentrum_lima.AAC.1